MASSNVEVPRAPEFARELARRCHVALATESVRHKVCKIIQDTLKPQCEGNDLPRVRHNQRRIDWASDWPFPIEHGVKETPGCILVLAALNDFAAEHASSSAKTHGEFIPLETFGNIGGAWFCYQRFWVNAVGKLSAEHEEKLRAVVDSALRELGVAAEEGGLDGPHGICQWRHDGIVTTDKMQSMTWNLAKYLYEHIGRKVPFGDLVGEDQRLFGDGIIEDQSIAKQGNKAKRWFKTHEIPLTVSSSTTECLIWMETVCSE